MSTVTCKVTVPDHVAVGEFANAFRVVHDVGVEWFLDFLAFSPSAKAAKLVARVRVQQAFLPQIQQTLGATMQQIDVAIAEAERIKTKLTVLPSLADREPAPVTPETSDPPALKDGD